MAIPNYSMATVPQFVGRSLGISEWVAVGQDRIDQFATCTGDRQWIHVDVERAKRESPFGVGLGRCAGDRAWHHSPDATTRPNYGLDKVRFITPVKSGARVRLQTNLTSAQPQSDRRMLLKLQCALEIEGEDKPALVAEVLCMLVGKPEGS